MGNVFNLGRLFSIQFRLHYTWFIIFILITVSLSWRVFPNSYPGWPLLLYWVIGIVTSLLFFASVLAHELAHSLIGRIQGIPIKSITLFIFGGMAEMTKEATHPSAEFKMAAAGPVCSLMIGGLFALFYFLTQSTIEPVAAMAFWLAYINVALAVFNLIPGFPLDGGRVFRSFLWGITGNYKRSTRIATRVGQGMGYLFILGGILIMFILHDWLGGLWLAFIGWFLRNAASLSYRQAQWREGLHRFTASEVMTSDCPVVLPSDSVDQLIQGYAFATGHRCFLVAENDRLMGMLTLHDTKTASQPNRRVTQVKEIMTPVDRLKVAHPDQDALSLLEQMGESNLNQMPVVSEGRVIGLVARHNLIRFLGIHPQPGSAS